MMSAFVFEGLRGWICVGKRLGGCGRMQERRREAGRRVVYKEKRRFKQRHREYRVTSCIIAVLSLDTQTDGIATCADQCLLKRRSMIGVFHPALGFENFWRERHIFPPRHACFFFISTHLPLLIQETSRDFHTYPICRHRAHT